ncbi:MAG: tetratricopeptide repeat protein [Planctomycetota bacterium]
MSRPVFGIFALFGRAGLLVMIFIGALGCGRLPGDERVARDLAREAAIALRNGDSGAARGAADQMRSLADEVPSIAMTVADVYLRTGEIELAVEFFDRVYDAQESQRPYLWRRGIALAFAERWEDAAKQFEIHRNVNPHDVENATWHFFCVAKSRGFDAAVELLLPAPGDERPPLEEVLQMYRTGDIDPVESAIESLAADSVSRRSAEFYGYLYVAMYCDAKGQPDRARDAIQRSVAHAGRGYMGDVARVYAKRLAD